MAKSPPESAEVSSWLETSDLDAGWVDTMEALSGVEDELSVMASEVSQFSLPPRLKHGDERTAHALQKALAATYAYRARATAIIVDVSRTRSKANAESNLLEAMLYRQNVEFRRLKTQAEKATVVCAVGPVCHQVFAQAESAIESARQIIKLCDGLVATAEAMTRAHYAVRDREPK